MRRIVAVAVGALVLGFGAGYGCAPDDDRISDELTVTYVERLPGCATISVTIDTVQSRVTTIQNAGGVECRSRSPLSEELERQARAMFEEDRVASYRDAAVIPVSDRTSAPVHCPELTCNDANGVECHPVPGDDGEPPDHWGASFAIGDGTDHGPEVLFFDDRSRDSELNAHTEDALAFLRDTHAAHYGDAEGCSAAREAN